jgi:hypothetical protein
MACTCVCGVSYMRSTHQGGVLSCACVLCYRAVVCVCGVSVRADAVTDMQIYKPTSSGRGSTFGAHAGVAPKDRFEEKGALFERRPDLTRNSFMSYQSVRRLRVRTIVLGAAMRACVCAPCSRDRRGGRVGSVAAGTCRHRVELT